MKKTGTIICLTGGAGAGKSRISEILREEYGFTVIDSDTITKEYVMNPGQEGYEKIVDYFGEGMVLPDKSLNRKVLAVVAFSDREYLEKLNSFTHPATIKIIKEKCNEFFARGEKIVFVESAIPFTADYGKFCDMFWYVYAKKSERIERLKKSRGYSDDKCRDIFKFQSSDKEYREHASVIINNTDKSDIDSVKRTISSALRDIFDDKKRP